MMPDQTNVPTTTPDFLARLTEVENVLYNHAHLDIDKTKKLNRSIGVPVVSATIATTGNTDAYMIAPENGVITSIDFSGVEALAASDTNYITWTITNLGQAGAGSTVILAATAANTTKSTGGSALAANTRRTMTLSGTVTSLQVQKGDRLLVRAAVTGTLANTVTFPTYMVRFGI